VTDLAVSAQGPAVTGAEQGDCSAARGAAAGDGKLGGL